MKLLAIDTALEACSAAVLTGDGSLARRVEPMTRGHQERLAPLVREVMEEAGLAFAGLDRLAVSVGPGSFTGVRVGLAFAKAAALALDIPCLGVGTLEALAAAPALRGAPLAAAVLDARRGRVYLQVFAFGVARSPPQNLPVEEAACELTRHGADASTPLVGSGAPLLRPGAPDGAQIDPVELGRLALAGAAQDRPPRPLYLRAPDARTLAERAGAAPR